MTRLLSVALAVTLLTACHKDLCYDHPHLTPVTVSYDWSRAPEALPTPMHLLMHPEPALPDIFPPDADSLRQRHFANPRGGTMTIDARTYAAISLTDGLAPQSLVLSADGRQVTTTVLTLPSPDGQAGPLPRPDGTNSEQVMRQPPQFYADTCSQVTFRHKASDNHLTLYPQDPLTHVTVTFEHVTPDSMITAVASVLTGLSASMDMTTLLPGIDRCTVPFDCVAQGDSITGNLLTFGYDPERYCPHLLVLYVVMADGYRYFYTFNVTDEIHHAPRPRHIHLRIGPIELPVREPEEGIETRIHPWTAGDSRFIEIWRDIP